MKLSIPSILLGALAAFAVWWTFPGGGAIEYSGFAVGLAKVAIGLAVYSVIDNITFWHVDTIHELVVNNNVAYAIVQLGFAIIIAAALVNV